MMRYRVFVILFVLSASWLYAQSLAEAVQIALQNNPQIQAAVHQMKRSEMEASAAFRRTLPAVNFDASYRHVTDVPELKLDLGGNIPITMPPVHLGAYDSYESGVSARYVLFSGFAQKNQVALKRRQARISKTQLSKIKKEIAFRSIAAYRQAQEAMLEIEALTSARKRIEAQLQRLDIFLEQGMTLALDTLSLSLSRLHYEQKLIVARANLQTVRQQLNTLAGKSIEISAADTSRLSELPQQLLPEQIEDLRNLQLQKEMARNSLALRKAAYFPTVAVQAAYKYGKPGLDMIKNEWMAYGVFGVSLHWNIFGWNADKLHVQAARESMRQIDYSRRALSDQIRQRFDKSLREYESLRAQGRVLQRALRLARRKMNIIKSQYEQGMSSATDFNTANLDLTEARLNVQRWRLRLALKLNELEFISGKPISAWSI